MNINEEISINCAWQMRHFPIRSARESIHNYVCTLHTMYTWLPYFLSLMQKQNVFQVHVFLILSPRQI